MPTPTQIAYLRTLQPIPPHFKGMGALEYHPRPSDWLTRHDPVIAAMIPKAPASASLLPYVTGPAYNQGATGACVAASTSGLCSTDTRKAQGAWHVFNWLQLYNEAGGTGSNGVDSRLVLKICTEQGTPLAAGGREFVVATYDFVTQSPGSFREEIKACIAAGFPVTIAALLPTDFGWMSGQPGAGVTEGYHQFEGYAYDDQFLHFLNSWGDAWSFPGAPRPGVGSIRWDYLEANNMQNRYCYAYRTTAKGGVTPAPGPTVTGYNPNPVASGQQFAISGTGFDQGAVTVTWRNRLLTVRSVMATSITANAPVVAADSQDPVLVQVGTGAVTGPVLSITAGIAPPVVKTATVAGKATGDNVTQLTTGQSYPLQSPAGVSVNFSSVVQDGGPPPPTSLTVSGYSDYTVPLLPGSTFTINGTGFSAGAPSASWGTIPLSVMSVSDTALTAMAPPGANGSNAVTVVVGRQSATGPLLVIGDGGPPPPGGITVLMTPKPSQLRNTLSVIAYTADANGNSLPASVNGTVVGSQGTVPLDGKTTHGTNSPAIWQNIPRPAPWGEAVLVTINAFGNGATGTSTKPG